MRRFITLFLTAVFLGFTASAQQTEPQDSFVQALREVVVTAKQPATKLAGSSLVSTIAGSSLQNAGNAFDVLQQLPMISIEDTYQYTQ